MVLPYSKLGTCNHHYRCTGRSSCMRTLDGLPSSTHMKMMDVHDALPGDGAGTLGEELRGGLWAVFAMQHMHNQYDQQTCVDDDWKLCTGMQRGRRTGR